MQKFCIKLLYLLIAFFLISISLVKKCNAGAWVQKKNEYYFKISGLSFESTKLYNQAGRLNTDTGNGKFTDFSLTGYLELGVSDFVTLISSLPYKTLRYKSARDNLKTRGASDLYLGLRYLLSDKTLVSSLQAGVNLSTGYKVNLDVRVDSTSPPPLGDGQTDFEVKLLLGNSFGGYSAYYNFDIGYRFRSGFPVNEIPFNIECGLHLGKIALLIGKINGVQALSEPETTFGGGTLSSNNLSSVEDFIKTQGQLVVHIGQKTDFIVSYTDVISGHNTAAGKSIGLSLAFQGSAR